MFMQLHYSFNHYLSLGLPFFSSCSPLLPSFLFGLLPPLIDDHLTDVEPALKTGKGKRVKFQDCDKGNEIQKYMYMYICIGSSKNVTSL